MSRSRPGYLRAGPAHVPGLRCGVSTVTPGRRQNRERDSLLRRGVSPTPLPSPTLDPSLIGREGVARDSVFDASSTHVFEARLGRGLVCPLSCCRPRLPPSPLPRRRSPTASRLPPPDPGRPKRVCSGRGPREGRSGPRAPTPRGPPTPRLDERVGPRRAPSARTSALGRAPPPARP